MKPEWENEPDRKEFRARGYLCRILRHETAGHLCGYVGVNKDHPLYDCSYSSPSEFVFRILLEEYETKPHRRSARNVVVEFAIKCLNYEYSASPSGVISVHGGLSWDGSRLPGNKRRSRLWWFGFDCGHAGDFSPMPPRPLSKPLINETYRNIKYVTLECRSLANQLKIIELHKNKNLLEVSEAAGRKVRL